MRLLQTFLCRQRLFAAATRCCVLTTTLIGLSSWAQTNKPSDCGATKCSEAVFDVAAATIQPRVGQYGFTKLMNAASADDLPGVTALIESGVEVNARDYRGATALLIASAHGSQDVVKQLLIAGADPNLADNMGDTPLSTAVQNKKGHVVILLLENGADPNVYDNFFRTSVLYKAAVTGQTDVVRSLLERGANVAESGLEALNAALWKHYEDIAAILVSTGIDVNAPTYDVKKHGQLQNSERVLQTAAEEGLVSSVELLIRHGADVNDTNSHGNSALHFAVLRSHSAVVSLLLDNGATATGSDLAAALGAGHLTLVQLLLESVDLRQLRASELDSLISMADVINDKETLRLLLNARQVIAPLKPATQLLFAYAGTDECQVLLWDREKHTRHEIFTEPGSCKLQLFVNRSEQSLYVVDEASIRIYELTRASATPRSIALPTEMINKNLSDLKARVSKEYGENHDSGVTAKIVQFGVLDSGNLAFAVHSRGPADETYGYVYALTGDTWRVIDQRECHRFEDCRFDQILGHSIRERPGSMAIWHSNIRLNPYFVDKKEVKVVDSEDDRWDGAVTFEIDARQTQVHYSKRQSGHCSGDCTYTTGMRLQLPNRTEQVLAQFSGNDQIVDRYALVAVQRAGQLQLIDLGTGESVLGNLQMAGWIH